MRRIKCLIVLFALATVFNTGYNIDAQLNYVDEETPAKEKYEANIETTKNDSVSSRSAVNLTIPKEGVYSNIIDTKNAKGVMTERRFYNNGKLVEKRIYTEIGSTDCRMKNKYLYYSNGSTIYTNRTYSNSGKTCYNLQTKRYSTSSKLQSHFIYEGKVNGKVKESRDYDVSGTYYTRKSYYKNGILDSREYWKGSKPNSISYVAQFEKSGKRWIKVTHYSNFNDKKISKVILYDGMDPNSRLSETKYSIEGVKQKYIKYNSNKRETEITYDESGEYKLREVKYYLNTNIFKEIIDYVEESNNRDVITYQDENKEVTKQLRYYQDGKNYRWVAHYVNGKKDNVDLYNKDLKLESNYKYIDNDFKMMEEFLYENGNRYSQSDVFKDQSLLTIIEDEIAIDEFDRAYFEDYLIINNINVDQKEKLNKYSEQLVIDNKVNNETTEVEESVDDASNLKIEIIQDVDGIKYLQNLKKLTINNTLLENIYPITYLKNLEHIDLANNNIAILEDSISSLNKLNYIDLKSNKVQEVTDKLNNLNNLDYLDLSNNEVSYINDAYLNIKKVNLSSNNISEISDNMIEEITTNKNNNKLIIEDEDFNNLKYKNNINNLLNSNKLLYSEKNKKLIDKVIDRNNIEISDDILLDDEGNLGSQKEVLSKFLSNYTLKKLEENENSKISLYKINEKEDNTSLKDAEKIREYTYLDLMTNFELKEFELNTSYLLEYNDDKYLSELIVKRVDEEKEELKEKQENEESLLEYEASGITLNISGEELEVIDQELDKIDEKVVSDMESTNEKEEDQEENSIYKEQYPLKESGKVSLINENNSEEEIEKIVQKADEEILSDQFNDEIESNQISSRSRKIYSGNRYTDPKVARLFRKNTKTAVAIRKKEKRDYKVYYKKLKGTKWKRKIGAIGLAKAGKYTKFASLVKGRGPWDYKQPGKLGNISLYKMPKVNLKTTGRLWWKKTTLKNVTTFYEKKKATGNKAKTGEWIGNAHYGYTGRIMGIPRNNLLKAAGLVQIKSNTWKWYYFGSNFDDPKDQAAIKYGMDKYYKYIRW